MRNVDDDLTVPVCTEAGGLSRMRRRDEPTASSAPAAMSRARRVRPSVGSSVTVTGIRETRELCD